MRRLLLVTAVMGALACYPTTTRPRFLPLPEAATAEVELFVSEATRTLALAFETDSIPVLRTDTLDGYVESAWFDVKTRQPVRGLVLGQDVVKVRGWIEPGKPNHSVLTIETVYRQVSDPSRDPRETERQVDGAHPVADAVRRILVALGAEP
ncbi:MAG TPA: hypothetical protein VFN90_05465 [Gemmatimonadales bacterium]|nr:hypothetical protein [Gemmatimonadales bacterium]